MWYMQMFLHAYVYICDTGKHFLINVFTYVKHETASA